MHGVLLVLHIFVKDMTVFANDMALTRAPRISGKESGVDALSALLNLSASEKLDRGITYTPHEIAQQPQTWETTFGQLRRRELEIQEFLHAAGIGNSKSPKPTVFLTGAGTSDYIGHSLHYLLQQQWQCEVIPMASTSLLTAFEESLLSGRNYLWISFSRSGDSPEGVQVLERALRQCPDVRHIVISCNAEGRMLRAIEGNSNSLGIVLDDAVNDRGLAMTSSFTNMVLAGQFLAHAWSADAYEPICFALCCAARALLPAAANLAKKLAGGGYERACFVGSASLTGAAMESALKLLELTAGKVQTMWQSTLALRHGPMAGLNAETLFVSLLSADPRRRNYELDLLREVSRKRLTRTVVAIAPRQDKQAQEEADHVLALDDAANIPDLYRPVLDVIFGQLLGLFASLEAGLKPDTPSPTGAISRVVQNIGTY
jgi:tagatose-6-phosphate ketose/aldose isomerase